MQKSSNVSAALFSLLWPGIGQLAQGRLVVGAIFVVWSSLGAIGLALAPSIGVSPFVIAGELVVVTLWAIVDAYRDVSNTRIPLAF